jgi:hypothetical protein
MLAEVARELEGRRLEDGTLDFGGEHGLRTCLPCLNALIFNIEN